MIGEEPPRSKKGLVLPMAGGILGAGFLLALALSLGSWAYNHRRLTLHDGRLRRLVQQHPGADDVARGVLSEEGNVEIPAPESEAELRVLAAQWSAARADEVVSKRRQWPTVRIFRTGGMVYFLYFDGDGKLRDYVLLSG